MILACLHRAKRGAVVLLMGLIALSLPVRAETTLTVLAEVEPWPVVSRLIGYRDRLWFANSVKGVNHNSADLYTYELKSGAVRYERHLFSQDAGRPIIAHGLLRWPLEDARFSLGHGHVVTTDGLSWREDVIPTGRIFHTHALAVTDRLIAATSAWRAHLDISTDAGRTWRQVHDHPTPERRVSRIVDLAVLGNRVFGSLVSRNERGLLRLEGDQVQPVPGWPFQRNIRALTSYGDYVYALVEMPEGTAIWRTDGGTSEQIGKVDSLAASDSGGTVRDLIADEQGLWLLTTTTASGQIWQSADGRDWERRYRIEGGEAFELARYRDRIFAGGTDRERGIGMLWGLPDRQDENAIPELDDTVADLDGSEKISIDVDWIAAGNMLDQLLLDPAAYQWRAGDLQALLLDLLSKNPPPGFFTSRLTATMPDAPLSLIGGAVEIPSALMGRALLLFAISLQGEGSLSEEAPIPISFLKAPWITPANRAEKYFDTVPFALFAVGRAGQRDQATIDALIDRLGRTDDPLWLTGDVVGALTALTDQRFAYDLEAWRSWWSGARSTWEARSCSSTIASDTVRLC